MNSIVEKSFDFTKNESFDRWREVSNTKKTCNYLFQFCNTKAFAAFKFGKLVNLYVQPEAVTSYLLDQFFKSKMISEQVFSYLSSEQITFDEFFDVVSELDVFQDSSIVFLKSNFIKEYILTLFFETNSVTTSIPNLILHQELESSRYVCLLSFLSLNGISIGELLLSKYELEKNINCLFNTGNHVNITEVEKLLDKNFLFRGFASKEKGLPLDQMVIEMPGLIRESIELLNKNIKNSILEINKVKYIQATNVLSQSNLDGKTLELCNSFESKNNTVSIKQRYTFNSMIFETFSIIAILLTIFSMLGLIKTFYLHFLNLN